MSRFSSSLRHAVPAAVLAALLAGGWAHAQPRTAIPWIDDRLGDQASPSSIQPFPEPNVEDLAAPEPAEPTPEEDALEQQLRDAIIGVAELPSIAAGSYGTEIWPEAVTDTLPQTLAATGPIGIHAADRLQREILLAPPPPELADSIAPDRIAALVNIGAIPEAYVSARGVREPSPDVLANLVRAGLLLDNGAEACDLTASVSSLEPNGLAGIFCTALRGEADRADLLLQFALDQGEANQTEAELLDAVITPGLEPPDLSTTDTPLTDYAFGLLLHLDQPFPANYAARAHLSQLQKFIDSAVPLDERLAALVRLEQAGLTSTKSLSDAYAIDSPAAGSDAQLWVRMLAAAQNSTTSSSTVKLVEAALKLGRLQDREDAAARLIAPAARDAFPSETTLQWARIMQRAFLLASDPDSALVWVPVPPNPDEVVLFSVALSGPPNPLAPEAAEQLAASFGTGDRSADFRLAALAAFGHAPTPDALRAQAPTALAERLTQATKAEAALVALQAIAGTELTPGLLHTVLTGLRDAGFEAAARQVAIEVLLLAT